MIEHKFFFVKWQKGIGGGVAESVSARLPISTAGELNAVSSAFRLFSGLGGTGREIGSLCQGALQ
jgi:hypothetical protein